MPRTSSSIQIELDAVEASITQTLKAQSYNVAGRSKTNAPLEALFKRRDMLQQQLDRTNGNAPMLVRGTVRGLH